MNDGPAPRRLPVWAPYAVAATGALAFAIRSLAVGQDANWDLQNYHRYAAHALLHRRYSLDMGAGGYQAYLNPLPYLLPYWLSLRVPAQLAAVVQAVVQSAMVPAVWLLAGRMQRRPGLLVQACATIAGLGSAMALSEIGTSFADLMLAVPAIAALAMMLRQGPVLRRFGWAGALVGVAAGLKMTNIVYVPALLLACLAGAGPRRQRLTAAAVAAAGVTAGVALTDGAWAAYLWHTLDNPIFPGLNTIFRSTSAGLGDFTDPQYRPADVLDALAYPFRIALGQHPTGAVQFRDPRFAVMTLLTAAALATQPWRLAAGRPLVVAWVFTVTAYAVWLPLFAIDRYALGLEVLSGVLAVHILAAWRPARAGTIAVATTLVLLAATQIPDWWHRPWSTAYVARLPPGVEQPAAFVLTAYPDGYWVTAMSRQSPFYSLSPIGLATGGVLRDRMEAGLAAPPGGRIWSLGPDIPLASVVRDQFSRYGLVPAKPCFRAPSLWWVDTIFCRLERAGARPSAAADLAVDETADFTRAGSGWIYEEQGWTDASSNGTSVASSEARLVFRTEAGTKQMLVATLAAPVPGVSLDAGGGIAAFPAAGMDTLSACVAPPPDGVVHAVFRSAGSGWLLRSIALRPARAGECGG